MAAMGLTAADYRLVCSEEHLNHFLHHVVPPIVKRPASVPFDSLRHAHEHLDENANGDVRDGILNIAVTLQNDMAADSVRDNEDEGEDVRDFDSATLYFPTGTTARQRTFISKYQAPCLLELQGWCDGASLLDNPTQSSNHEHLNLPSMCSLICIVVVTRSFYSYHFAESTFPLIQPSNNNREWDRTGCFYQQCPF